MKRKQTGKRCGGNAHGGLGSVRLDPSFVSELRRVYPNAVSFRDYIAELNSTLNTIHGTEADSPVALNPQICLDCSDQESPSAFTRLLNHLYVAWPGEKRFPPDVIEGICCNNPVSLDQVLQDVIYNCLRRNSCTNDAQIENVLCNGFSLASPRGQGSVLRDLDSRSPSSQLQILRSPAWRCLLSRIGHVLLRDLLANNILLVAIENSALAHGVTKGFKGRQTSSAFLQLCGPMRVREEERRTQPFIRTATNIILKQDLLYRNPSSRSRKVDGQSCNGGARMTRSVSMKSGIPCVANNGLPKSHHLQGLDTDSESVRTLLQVIFCEWLYGRRDGRMRSYDRQERNEKFCSRPCKLQTQGSWFVQNAIPISKAGQTPMRGKEWLRRRKAQFRRLPGIFPVLRKVITRTQKLCIRRILGRSCPLPVSFRQQVKNTSFNAPHTLISMASGPGDVAKFLTDCTRHLIPTDLLGSHRNRVRFEKGIHRFIRHRLSRERFNVGVFSSQSGISLSDIHWLHGSAGSRHRVCNPTDLAFRKTRIEELFVWLFRGVLLPLLEHNFYATETDPNRNKIFFFRREVWVRLADAAIGNSLRAEKKFTVLSKDRLAKCTADRAHFLATYGRRLCPYPVFLYNHLRFVPKRYGLRGIQRPRAKMLRGFSVPGTSRIMTKSFCVGSHHPKNIPIAKACTKRFFRFVLNILKSESEGNKSVTGAAVFSFDDVYEKVLCFKRCWKARGCPSMFICTVDITASFDTIPLNTLFDDVVPSLLSKDRYVLINYKVSQYETTRNRVISRTLTHVCQEPGEEALFPSTVKDKLVKNHSGAVFTDLVHLVNLSRTEILLSLTEFLANNIVSVPRRKRKKPETGFAVQRRGLPQGHSLSPLLTSLLYGHVERKAFPALVAHARSDQNVLAAKGCRPEPDLCSSSFPLPHLLMRQVDDSIFVTTCKKEAVTFLKRMSEGWNGTYGYSVNMAKTKCNFKTQFGSKETNEDIAWCGLLFSTNSLQIMSDYSRYDQCGKGRLRHALFVEHDIHAGCFLAEKAWNCFKPKLHLLLLDSQLNSRRTVTVNIYQAALLSCLKLCSYCVVIKPTESYLAHIIHTMSTNFVSLIMRCMSSRLAVANKARLPVSRKELHYLTAHAFRNGIQRKLAPRKEMSSRIYRTQAMLAGEIDILTSSPPAIHSIAMLADNICNTCCNGLWSLRL